MTTDTRAELESRIFRELQDVRFQIEQIVAQPEKAQFNQSRASQAIKTLKRIESELSQLLGKSLLERENT